VETSPRVWPVRLLMRLLQSRRSSLPSDTRPSGNHLEWDAATTDKKQSFALYLPRAIVGVFGRQSKAVVALSMFLPSA